MLKKIFLALFIGLMVTLFFAQYDSWLKQELVTYLRVQTENALNCSIKCSVRSINFFMPKIVLDDVQVCSRIGDEWQWSCKRYTTRFSWWHLIRYGMLDLYIELDNYCAQSQVRDGQLSIAQHIQAILEAPMLPVPSTLRSIKLHKACFTVVDEKNDLSSTIHFNSESKFIGAMLKSTLYFTDGDTVLHGRTLFSHFGGTLEHETNGQHHMVVRANCSLEIPQLPNGTCFVTGVLQNGRGHFALQHVEQAFAIDPIIITTRDNGTCWLQTTVRLPLSYVWNLVNDTNEPPIKGTCIAHIRGDLNRDSSLEGKLIIQDVCWYDQLVCSAFKVEFNRRDKVINGSLQARIQKAEIDGSWQWSDKKTGNLTLYNRGEIAVPWACSWHISPRAFSVAIKKDETGMIDGFYACKAISTTNSLPCSLNGTLGVRDGIFNASGAINGQHYSCRGSLVPALSLEKLTYTDEAGKELIRFSGTADTPEKINGAVSYSFIRWLLQKLTNYDVQGEGTVQLQGDISKEKVSVDMHLAEGTIRLPQTYNFINACDARLSWHFPSRTLLANDVHCSLHTGHITSSCAVLQFNNQGLLTFAHVPLILDHCLCNVKRDLFAMISGSLLFEKRAITPRLSGRIIVDRAQLKENIFSSDFQKQFFDQAGNLFASSPHIDMQLDVGIETKYPIRIDTALLQADAAVDVAIGNCVTCPSLSGSIRLLSGSMLFPYKPLQITRGTITFLPDQLHNPMIELMAKNTIKKYNVTLYVSGFLQDHQVLLDASPPLTEEQIITLLLVGSEDQSLNVMMPALIVQNLKTALLGSDQASFFDKYLKRSYIPFNINLVPSFTDQTGRGGLRGGIEITVNDRWRALIQKNFSLTEDTRFELEYLLSDDISLRAIRDERRDIGGEIEMRWKF